MEATLLILRSWVVGLIPLASIGLNLASLFLLSSHLAFLGQHPSKVERFLRNISLLGFVILRL
jgi:hypothetical protein